MQDDEEREQGGEVSYEWWLLGALCIGPSILREYTMLLQCVRLSSRLTMVHGSGSEGGRAMFGLGPRW